MIPVTPAPSSKDGTGRIGIQVRGQPLRAPNSLQSRLDWGRGWRPCKQPAQSAARPWPLTRLPTARLPTAPQLASNAEILRKSASNPAEAVALATQEYFKLTGTVLKGKNCACTGPDCARAATSCSCLWPLHAMAVQCAVCSVFPPGSTTLLVAHLQASTSPSPTFRRRLRSCEPSLHSRFALLSLQASTSSSPTFRRRWRMCRAPWPSWRWAPRWRAPTRQVRALEHIFDTVDGKVYGQWAPRWRAPMRPVSCVGCQGSSQRVHVYGPQWRGSCARPDVVAVTRRSLCRLTAAWPPPNSLFRTDRHPLLCGPTWAAGLYQFAALVNINLAIVNILPLPALDGERALAAAQHSTPSLLWLCCLSCRRFCCLSLLPLALRPLPAAAAGWLPCLRLSPLLPAVLPCCLGEHARGPTLPHPAICPALRLAAGGELALVGVEAAQGRSLDRDVRDLIAVFGNGFIVLLAIWMVTNDLEALGSFMFNQAAQLTGAPAPEEMLPLATALLPLLPPLL